MDALNHLVMTNLLTNLLFLIVGLGYGVTFVLMKEILAGLSFSHNGASLYEWQLVASNLYRGGFTKKSLNSHFHVCMVKESLQFTVICLPYLE